MCDIRLCCCDAELASSQLQQEQLQREVKQLKALAAEKDDRLSEAADAERKLQQQLKHMQQQLEQAQQQMDDMGKLPACQGSSYTAIALPNISPANVQVCFYAICIFCQVWQVLRILYVIFYINTLLRNASTLVTWFGT